MSQTNAATPTTSNLVREQWLSTKEAVREVVRFERRFGEKHLKLACHAALPLIVTPELVNLIRINFLSNQDVPWVAEADFLLSSLCRPMGEDLYEVEPSIREVLMVELERTVGLHISFDIARCLQVYTKKQNLKTEAFKILSWVAQAYLEPDRVVGKITQSLKASESEQELLPKLQGQLQAVLMVEVLSEQLTYANDAKAYQKLMERSQKIAEDLYRTGGDGPAPLLVLSQPLNDPFVEPFGGGTGIRFTVRNLKLNGEGNTLTLAHGSRIEATLEINHDCSECGGAINQIIIGLAGENRAQACVWIGRSSSNGWQTVSFSLNIPAKPGVYYIRTRYAQAYNAEDSLHWWTVDRPNGPTEESNIGAVAVQSIKDKPEYPYQLYRVKNQGGGSEGDWMFGGRSNQENIASINIRSDNGRETLTGTVTYSSGEGSVQFSATSVGMSNYIIEKQQGGNAELWVIGGREAQNRISSLDCKSDDDGQTLNGTLVYAGEGPIDFTGTRISPSEVLDLKTAFFRVTGETCPVFSRLVTFQEAMANKALLSEKLDRWDIAKLADGGSMDGPGYRSKIRANDDRSFGHALCRTLDLTANPDSNDTPPLLTFEFDVVEFVLTFEFETVTVNVRGEKNEPEKRQASFFEETLGEGVPPLAMVAIPGDSFLMGAPENEKGRAPSEGPQHPVNVPEFFMGKYPVTQAQWRFVAGLPQEQRSLNPDPSRYKGDNHPVEQISWFDAVEFCDRLSSYTGRTYRLPSEAEWEYACRAGTTTPFHFGETITSTLANYNANSTYQNEPEGANRQGTTPVGSFGVANRFGLFDMHGNVWEWCADHWHENYEGAPDNGSAWISEITETLPVCLRGGSWDSTPESCRSARRNYYLTHGTRYNTRGDAIGLRVVCSIPKT